MSLGVVLERMSSFLQGNLAAAPPRIGGALPAAAADVPALSLSLMDITEVPAGVGNVPRPPARGALEVIQQIDLSSPVLDFNDGVVELVSDGGHVLRLPHSPLVHADGAPVPPPLAALDIEITVGGVPVALVSGVPGAGEFRVDPEAAEALGYGDPESAGVLRFGDALTTGTLRARYHVGEWEITAVRYRGELRVDVFAQDAAGVAALSNDLGATLLRSRAAALGRVYVLTPTSLGFIGTAPASLGASRTRALTYRFDVEFEEPLVRTGGGVISVVEATIHPPSAGETFDIHRREEIL